jgi:hypothetical protein
MRRFFTCTGILTVSILALWGCSTSGVRKPHAPDEVGLEIRSGVKGRFAPAELWGSKYLDPIVGESFTVFSAIRSEETLAPATISAIEKAFLTLRDKNLGKLIATQLKGQVAEGEFQVETSDERIELATNVMKKETKRLTIWGRDIHQVPKTLLFLRAGSVEAQRVASRPDADLVSIQATPVLLYHGPAQVTLYPDRSPEIFIGQATDSTQEQARPRCSVCGELGKLDVESLPVVEGNVVVFTHKCPNGHIFTTRTEVPTK